MGRHVKIRAGNYKEDAAFLMRLEQAIESDDTRPKEWKEKASNLLKQLYLMFLQS